MKNFFIKKILPAVILSSLLLACKKDEEASIPATSPKMRNFALTYTNNQDENQQSFASLDESKNAVFNWSIALNNSEFIHFGFGESGGSLGLFSPEGNSALAVYADGVFGVGQWMNKVGVTFENGNAPNVNFDELTAEFIEGTVPDAGFGVNNNSEITNITAGQIIRFIEEENNVLKYKGYMKVTSVNNGNPKSVSVQVKYIKK